MSERNPILVELCEAIGYHAAQIAAEGEMAPNTWLMRTLDKVEAALAAAPAQERIQALELEVRQLTEQIARLRHAPAPQADSQPAPVMEDTPPPCDQELFDQGVSVGLFDIPKWTAEELCRGIAAATEARVDWHYLGGHVHIKALPAARAQAQAGAVPLTDEQIDQAIAELGLNYLADAHATNRAVLQKLCRYANSIKGGQHDI